jgi:hypothetical protein
MILEEDEDTLLFSPASGEEVLNKVLTEVEHKLLDEARRIGKQFTFSDVLDKARSKNRKALSKALRKATDHGLLSKQGKGKGTTYEWITGTTWHVGA